MYNFFSLLFINYAIIQTSIFDFDFTLYLNIDEKVFLYNRTLLFLYINYLSLIRRIKFITITKVANM